MKWITLSLTFLLTYFPFSTAMAAQEGESEFMTYWTMGWRIINFLILLVLIIKLAKKPLTQFLEDRNSDIGKDLKEAETVKQKAESEFDEITQKINELDTQVAQITQIIEDQGVNQKERIIKNAKKTSERLLREAEEYSKFELRKAQQRLKNELADMAIDMAMEKIQEKITAEDQDKLTSDYIKNIAAAA